MIRRHLADLGLALKSAQYEANARGEAARVWRLTKKDGVLRFDVLYLNETPKGDGWEMLYEVEPDLPDDKR